MSILSVDNISPIGSGTSVTINNAATLVVNNVNVSGVTTCGSTSESFTELQIKSSTSGIGELRFADTTVNAGYVKYEHSNNALVLATNTSERLRIQSNGDVIWNGIGTQLAGEGNNTVGMGFEPRNGTIFLSRGDNATILSNRNNDGRHIHFNQGGSGKFAIGLQNSGADLAFFSGAGNSPTERVRISSNGAVIVAGTTAYSDGTFGEAKLQFNTKTGNHIGACSVADSTNSITHVLFKNPNGAIASVGTHNSDFIALTGNVERLRITSGGVIGINDTNPGSGKKVKVVVANNSSYQMIVNLTNNVNADINFYIKTNESLIAPSTNTPLCLGNGGVEKLKILTNGHLTTQGNNNGNPVGMELRNNNTAAYSHAELALTSQNATTSKVWCDVPNAGMRLQYNGGTTVKVNQSGNLVMASGSGIDFSATGNTSSGSSHNELLDDYEEGQWSPGVKFGGTTATVTSNGKYTKIGNLVHITYQVSINNLNSGTGTIRCTNLPFTPSQSPSYSHGNVQGNSNKNLPSNAGSTMPYVETNQTEFRILYDTPTAHGDVNETMFDVSTTFYGDATYFTTYI